MRKAEEKEDPLNGEQTANWVAKGRTWRRGRGKGRVENCRQNHAGEDLEQPAAQGSPERWGSSWEADEGTGHKAGGGTS